MGGSQGTLGKTEQGWCEGEKSEVYGVEPILDDEVGGKGELWRCKCVFLSYACVV